MIGSQWEYVFGLWQIQETIISENYKKIFSKTSVRNYGSVACKRVRKISSFCFQSVNVHLQDFSLIKKAKEMAYKVWKYLVEAATLHKSSFFKVILGTIQRY